MNYCRMLGNGSIVPFGQQVIEYDFQVVLDFIGGIAAGFVESPDHVDRRFQSSTRCRFSHQVDDGFHRVKQHACASATDVRKQTSLNRVVFRAIAGVMGHANFNADGVGQGLQLMFENVPIRRVAAAAIA